MSYDKISALFLTRQASGSHRKPAGKRTYVLKGLMMLIFGFTLTHLQAQNMMTELDAASELAWYNKHFSKLEDSVVHYREAIKQPQIPAKRKRNLEEYQVHLQQYRAALRAFVLQHKTEDTAAKALLMSCFREIDVNQDSLKAMASLLLGRGATNTYANYLDQELQGRENNQRGKKFIDFSMADAAGQQIRSSDYRGKYLLINFWASWCGPCRAEMPSLLAVYHQFKGSGLEVIAVSVDTDRSAWLRAKGEDKTDWLNTFDAKAWNSPVVRNYAIHRIPQNILVGPDGNIIAKNISATGLTKLMSSVKSATTK